MSPPFPKLPTKQTEPNLGLDEEDGFWIRKAHFLASAEIQTTTSEINFFSSRGICLNDFDYATDFTNSFLL
jgi:hypothetical protein